MNRKDERPTAVLVAVQTPEVSDDEHEASLAELGRLVHTLGYRVAATVSQKRTALAHTAVLGEGKLRELAALTGGSGELHAPVKRQENKARAKWEAEAAESASEPAGPPDLLPFDVEALDPKPALVAVDHEITPSQARNLERATEVEVLDRTGVIVEIFHRHAKSREARLQVEIARLNYVAPRMREAGVGKGERQAGKGAGESALELDRRKIRDRIAELREELEHVAAEQRTRRAARRELRRVALIGYTNAGKSSLMRALTGSEVLVEDKLFATLDTTVRALHPETKPRILVSDTVGFIKKLPHDLVASFRSTLDEALEASLLLFVVDASDPTHESQLEVTREVLGEIGALGENAAPSFLVLNKMDRVDEVGRAALRAKHPNAIMLSAKRPEDVAALRTTIIEFFDRALHEAELVVPYDRQSLVADMHESARVISETYDERGAVVRLRADEATLARFGRALERR
jgi:GTP-binding protein HflX